MLWINCAVIEFVLLSIASFLLRMDCHFGSWSRFVMLGGKIVDDFIIHSMLLFILVVCNPLVIWLMFNLKRLHLHLQKQLLVEQFVIS